MKKIDYPKLVISVLIPLLVGFSSSFFMNLNWYQTLNKPWFTPPDWVFAPIWTTLYILMGISFYLIWINDKKDKNVAILVYGSQLSLNFMWTFVFFGLTSPMLGMFTISALLIQIISNIDAFYKIDKTASYLLIPYLIWVCIATILNLSIILLN